ncbi:indole-diterpene biosynthesis protein PaxU, putative [Talaromyces stipitatus ATCC 10500]|uniref:Indole-diterpene biosynthesis protein PaxU, putative n=1 Tax=Talaromyces stipitatus (strain ATCC 10500 / CBS 375.48 / QM 6759 / NRRL 1006) TaxID=441959 RepID=B8MJE5_TALSN|nr:indole-diterpene biosynthesis protein PaxU, putative [Talaromyces stipitatus ATCC 10500]EED15145.1 indole-diterpene biosynthesis protein PaxU, putative [Talaromyces stipitatus ATCC 10500]
MSPNMEKFDPLSPFNRLAPSIYVMEPRREPTKDDKSPSTILLPFWMNAPPRAAVKYVVKYAELVPSARIIFLLTDTRDFYISRAAHELRLKPVIDILAAALADKEETSENACDNAVYIHLFSNGGVFATAQLLQAYKTATGRPLRVSNMILDSAPGRPTPSLSIKALSFGLPQTIILRQLSYALLTAMIWSTYLSRKFLSMMWRLFWKQPDKNDGVVYGDDPLTYTRKTILDPEFVVARTSAERTRMCYIYSDSDELVPWKDVEEHAALASNSKNGAKVVEMERFSGTPHVGHMRSDPERLGYNHQTTLRLPKIIAAGMEGLDSALTCPLI